MKQFHPEDRVLTVSIRISPRNLERITAGSISQGAITGLSALVERPEAYRWVVALNGYLAAAHEECVAPKAQRSRGGEAAEGDAAAAGKPVFVGCGAHDQVIPPERAERAAETLDDAGAEVRFERYGIGHGTTPEEVTDVVEWVGERY